MSLPQIIVDNKIASSVALAGTLMVLTATQQQKKKGKKGRHEVIKGTTVTTIERVPVHSCLRLAYLANGGAVDHAKLDDGEAPRVTFVLDPDFDLDNTIFKSLDSQLNRVIMKAKLGNQVYWSDSAQAAVRAAYAKRVSPAPSLADPSTSAIFDFMESSCNFACEHADGSFLDHLHFCRDYSAVHYQGHSPNVLLLHSICGVATNLFPMPLEKLPQLAAILTKEELMHVEAFPSVLRLLYNLELIAKLKEAHAKGSLGSLKAVQFRRVLDNSLLELSAADFWVHMNYQMMHLLDFLPAAYWSHQLGDPLFGLFIEVHAFLKEVGKLDCTVNFSLSSPGESDPSDGTPMSLGRLVSKYAPAVVQRALAAKSVRRFSSQVGHDLTFQLSFV